MAKRHTTKAKSTAHLEACLAEGHTVKDLATLLQVHVTTVNGWLSTPGTAPAWTETILRQRTQLIKQRAVVCFIRATKDQANMLDKILDIVDLKVIWLDQ